MTPSEFQAVLQSLLTQQRELITAERAALEAELKAAHLRTEELLQAELDRERAARLQAEERLRELTEAQARRWWHRG